MKPQARRRALIGSALILLGACGFSAKSILIKLAYADGAPVDAVTLMTLRMLMSLPFFLYPTMVVVVTAMLYRRPIGGAQRWALVLCYAGILLVYGQDPRAGSAELGFGALLVLGSALTFAVYMLGCAMVVGGVLLVSLGKPA